MPAIDFKEIPQANTGTGEQDSFELFSRDFLRFLGYDIVTDPARGADGGADLIVQETRKGVGGETEVRWLVSCKHYAHSGKSVSPQDEQNIRDRVEASNCDGFIGFYSTLASSGLMTSLASYEGKFEFHVFDHKKIEASILHSTEGTKLAKRYFPESIEKWATENPKPAKIFVEDPTLKCKYCDKELLSQDSKGIIVIWEKYGGIEDNSKEKYEEIYWCCKGHCDSTLSHQRRGNGCIDRWDDIPDVMVPSIYLRWVMSIMNGYHSGAEYSDEAFEQLKEFLINIFPHVAREITEKEKERIGNLSMIPTWLGGLDG